MLIYSNILVLKPTAQVLSERLLVVSILTCVVVKGLIFSSGGLEVYLATQECQSPQPDSLHTRLNGGKII